MKPELKQLKEIRKHIQAYVLSQPEFKNMLLFGYDARQRVYEIELPFDDGDNLYRLHYHIELEEINEPIVSFMATIALADDGVEDDEDPWDEYIVDKEHLPDFLKKVMMVVDTIIETSTRKS